MPAIRSPDSPTAKSSYEEVTIAAEYRLRSCKNRELGRLQCEVQDGWLIIRGQVSSYYFKQLAQELVRSLVGVDRIVNQLEVVYVQTKHREMDAQEGNALANLGGCPGHTHLRLIEA